MKFIWQNRILILLLKLNESSFGPNNLILLLTLFKSHFLELFNCVRPVHDVSAVFPVSSSDALSLIRILDSGIIDLIVMVVP